MARYIDVDKLKKDLKELPEQERIEYMGIYDVVNSQPAADVQEVKHGEWVTATTGLAVSNKHYYCSVCHRMTPANAESKYCPNCGAKMKRSRRK